jgi:pimeloyl-ACP methyl ester carboxylesterase
MLRPFSFSTACPLHHECSSRSSAAFPIVITLSLPNTPALGHSDWPDPKQFAYTFDNLAKVINGFTAATGISRYTLYMQDYGAPVGFRVALAHPNRIEALIVQDGLHTTMDWGRTGPHGVPFGRIALLTKPNCTGTCCRLQLQRRTMLAMIPTWNFTTLICGPTSSRF